MQPLDRAGNDSALGSSPIRTTRKSVVRATHRRLEIVSAYMHLFPCPLPYSLTRLWQTNNSHPHRRPTSWYAANQRYSGSNLYANWALPETDWLVVQLGTCRDTSIHSLMLKHRTIGIDRFKPHRPQHAGRPRTPVLKLYRFVPSDTKCGARAYRGSHSVSSETHR